MTHDIRKVVVIGAGVMGAGIAAQVANAGVPVLLLDIVPKDATNRNAIAEGAVAKMLKADPAPFMSTRAARLVETGNVEDHLARLADCDWIIEAVIERPDIKQDLYRRIEAVRKPGTVVSSNTSTLPLAVLTKGLPDSFAADFCITHFFNPPRYMRLLEVISGPATNPQTVTRVSAFADVALGKSVVACKDRPGFIANRLGILWLLAGVVEAIDNGLSVEDADAIIGRPFGIPKTGVFGLLDLVGLDLMPHVIGSMVEALPKDDAFHLLNTDLPLIRTMIEAGYTGRKGKGGFYRLNTTTGAKVKEAVDLQTGDYRRSEKSTVLDAARDAGALLAAQTPAGRYARRVMARTLAYACDLVPDVSDDIAAIDEAMRLGYNWSLGPFELIDRIGADALSAALRAEGLAVPRFLDGPFYRIEDGRRQRLGIDGAYHDIVRPAGVLMLDDIRRTTRPLLKTGSAALWDVGDGVACLEFTSKMNALDTETLALIGQAIPVVGQQFKALVIYNEGTNFSVGANLGLALFAANIAAWPMLEDMVKAGQAAYKGLKYAPFPVVGAPAGMALGGGCEILLHCDAIQAHAETYMGLVEVGVGLIPGWGGCKELLLRHAERQGETLPKGPMPPVAKAFETISTATVSKSAAQAQELGYLRPSDGITMNRYRLLADAKAKALSLVEGYQPPAPPQVHLPGPSGKAALDMALGHFRRLGKATPHDAVVATELAGVLSGGNTDHLDALAEDDISALECAAFLRLVRHPDTLARIEHMLETGKPLRN